MKRRNFVGYFLLFLGGCAVASSNPNERASKSAGTRPEKLRFAVTDAKGMEDLQQHYEPFRQALEQVLETPVEFFPVDNFTAAGSALHLDRVDLVLAGPSEYVIIHARTNAVPVVELTRPGYSSAIVVRADSGITSLRQLKGKTIAMREIGSTSGHLGSTKMLMDAGLNPQSDFKTVMLGKEGFKALKNGEVDAWCSSTFSYERTLKSEGVSKQEFPAIAIGPPLPNDIFIASSKLDIAFIEEMRSRLLQNQDRITSALLATNNLDSRFQNASIVPANDENFNMIREAYKATGQGDLTH